MTELGNIFEIIEQEKELYHLIKVNMSDYDKLDANVTFNYCLYYCLYYVDSWTIETEVLKCLLSFVAKETNILQARAIIDNTYQITIMQDKDFILRLLKGQESNFIKLGSDAAKLGALLALYYKLSSISKLEILKKALLLSKNMI